MNSWEIEDEGRTHEVGVLLAAAYVLQDGLARGVHYPPSVWTALQAALTLYNAQHRYNTRIGPLSIPWLFSFSVSHVTNEEGMLLRLLGAG